MFTTLSCHVWLSVPLLLGLEEMLRREEIPVDVLRIVAQIPRDHRHASKPNTGVLFAQPSYWKHILVLAVVFFLLALLKYFI